MGRHALVIQSLLTERRFLVHFLLITSLFFLWAFDVNLNDILIPHLNKAFSLTDFQSSFIQVAFFGGYCLPPFLPVGLWRRCATGAVLFLPAFLRAPVWILSLCAICHGLRQSFLEVAANPYVTILGPAEGA
jgi:FHS family L-fucose permease-like MFS transporter